MNLLLHSCVCGRWVVGAHRYRWKGVCASTDVTRLVMIKTACISLLMGLTKLLLSCHIFLGTITSLLKGSSTRMLCEMTSGVQCSKTICASVWLKHFFHVCGSQSKLYGAITHGVCTNAFLFSGYIPGSTDVTIEILHWYFFYVLHTGLHQNFFKFDLWNAVYFVGQ